MCRVIALLGAACLIASGTAQVESTLRPGEAIGVVSDADPSFCTMTTLDANGLAKVPVLGSVALAGLSTLEAGDLLRRRWMSRGLAVGAVSVHRIRTKGAPILFRGALRRSGECPARSGMRLGELLAYAEPTESADLRAVEIEDATGSLFVVDFRPGSPSGDPELRAGDRVFVPLARGPNAAVVLGAVARPGAQEWRTNLTLKLAIEEAGGLSKNADPTRIELVRAGLPIQTLSLSSDGEASIERGDVVRVLFTSDPKHVYVLGLVAKEGRYAMTSGMTLTEAVHAAGGVLPNAPPLRVTIARRESGELRRKTYDLAAIQEGRAADAELRPGDIIEVLPRGNEVSA